MFEIFLFCVWKAYIAVHFLLRTPFAAFHKFCMVVFSFSFVSRCLKFPPRFHHWYFNGMLFRLYVAVFILVSLSVISL